MHMITEGRGPTIPLTQVDQVQHSISPEGTVSDVETLLRDPRLLDRIGDAIQSLGYAGDLGPPKLAYVELTSRLLPRPMNLNVVAPSATGKSETVDKPLELMPDEAYYRVQAASPRALIYSDEEFEHRVIVMAEADSIPEEGPAAAAIRSLASDNQLAYDVVEKSASGRFETRSIRKDGPTGLITTSTRSLGPQMGTRVLEVHLPDDPGQTKEILRAQARRAQAPEELDAVDVEPFLELQRWLTEEGERRVSIPFAGHLAEEVPTHGVRMRRDFQQLLTCIQAIALLYQCQRNRDASGAIIATIEDYEQARRLLAPVFDAVCAEGLTLAIRETVEAVRAGESTSESDLAKRLSRSKSTTSYRVKRAVDGGWLVNEEWRQGHPARLVRGVPLPDAATSLPSVERILRRMGANNARPLQSGGATCTE